MSLDGTITRYAITHLNHETGLRQLTFANQGRNHYPTYEAADKAMHCLEADLRTKILANDAGTLEVRAVECYAHGDATGIYFQVKFRQLGSVDRVMRTCRSVDWLTECKCCCCGQQLGLTDWYDTTSPREPKLCYCTACIKAALELQQIFGGETNV